MKNNFVNKPTLYFYVPGKCHPQDVAVLIGSCSCLDGKPSIDQYRGEYSGKTFEEFKAECPSVLLLEWEDMQEYFFEAAKKPVSEINEERYNDMLDVLPPLKWRSQGGNSSFMLSEMYTDNITDIFAKIKIDDSNYRYFTLRDKVSLSQIDIYQRCMEHIAAN